MEENKQEEVKKEDKEKPIEKEVKQEVTIKKQKDMGQIIAQNMVNQVIEFTKISGETFDEKAKTFAIDIITGANKIVVGNNYNWNDVDLVGCGFVNQIKRWSKIGVSMEDKLYIDIRPNGKTGKKDITIKAQYQTLEKIMVKYFTKPIIKFKTEVICVGDVFEHSFDFDLAREKVTKWEINKNIDRNNLDNIVGAYKIIFIKTDNGIEQIITEIDKNRIMRAYSASPSREKTVWKNDTIKMVKKTVTWEAFNSEDVRPFLVYPDDIIQDISVVEESQEMDWEKETKHKNVIDVQDEVKCDVATGEVLEF